jgi:serine phosphatase RsbU (regulator of sigma subunit)
MARRARDRTNFAAPAGVALALSISIGLALGLAPASADPAGQSPAPVSEVAESPPAGGVEETTAERRVARKAERAAARSERVAARSETTDSGAAPGATTVKGPAAGGTGAASRAARRAEHQAKRAEHRSASAAPSTKNVTRSAADTKTAAAKSKGPTEKEREAKHRQREERRQKNGTVHETRKEKQARIAQEELEAKEGREGLGTSAGAADGAVAVSASAGGLAPASGPESAAAAPSAATIVGERGVAATRNSHARGAHRRRTAGGSALLGAPTGAAATFSAGSALGAGAGKHKQAAARRHSSSASSPLVTTVTRIIGVIPTMLWLLIGALALAAVAFATTSRLAARRARRLERQRRELLEDVGLLQAALLPELPARLGPVGTSADYRPASGPGAGGDFYDVFALPEGLVAVIVGDVSGHGRDALPHTTLLRYTLRAYLEAGLTPREALRAAAPALERQLGDSFATVVLATYDPRRRLLSYSCAGHPHPLLTGLGAGAAVLASSAAPIGAGRATGTRQTVVSVPGAAVAAFYTDGVIEARTDGELYGEQRLAGTLEGLAEDGERPSAAELLNRVRAQTDRRPDDMAACLLTIPGGEGRPTIVREEIELDGRESERSRTRRFLMAAGVAEKEIDRVLGAARAIAADHGSALLTIDKSEGTARLSLTHNNVAPLRARALARTQEVAL